MFQRYRKCNEELQNEKLNVRLLISNKEELEKYLEELKNDTELNKDKLRKAVERIKEMDREIRNKNQHIDDLTHSKHQEKREKNIQDGTIDVDKMKHLLEVTSNEQEEKDREINEMIEGN